MHNALSAFTTDVLKNFLSFKHMVVNGSAAEAIRKILSESRSAQFDQYLALFFIAGFPATVPIFEEVEHELKCRGVAP